MSTLPSLLHPKTFRGGVQLDPYHGVESDPYHGVESDPYHGTSGQEAIPTAD